MAPPYRILLADDYAMFRQELKKIINATAGLTIVGEAATGTALYQLLEEIIPHLLILDISMPQFRAMEATRRIKQDHPEVKVLIMVMNHEEEYVIHAIRSGADGVLLKQYTAAELLKAINTIRSGKFYLPPQFDRRNFCKSRRKHTLEWGQASNSYF